MSDTTHDEKIAEAFAHLQAIRSEKKPRRKLFFALGLFVGAGIVVGAYETGLVDDVMEKLQ